MLSAQAINVGSGVSRITHDDFKCTTGPSVPLGQKPAVPPSHGLKSPPVHVGGLEGADLSPRPLVYRL